MFLLFQAIYWILVFISAQNLICIATERYLAVCHPITFFKITKKRKKAWFVVLGLYLYGFGLVLTPGILQMMVTPSGQCMNSEMDTEWRKYYFGTYTVVWFVCFYLATVIVTCTLYCLIIKKLRDRNQKHQKSKKVQSASLQTTATVVAVTIFYIVFMSYDSIYYLLGFTGIVVYEHNSATQIPALFLVALNSAVNPVIYLVGLPQYRKTFRAIFCRRKTMHRNNQTIDSYGSNNQVRKHQMKQSIESLNTTAIMI